MRRLMAMATAGTLALTGATALAATTGGTALAAAPTTSAAPAATAIDWTACDDAALAAAGAECGFLSVPLNWAKPGGKKIQVAVSRVEATDTENRQGVMLVNPGGPGGSGLAFATRGAAVPDGVGGQFDWIGFDPRGVGASKPALSCDTSYFDGPRPRAEPQSEAKRSANEKAWIARTKKYAKDCVAKNGELIRNVRTIDTIRDMDALRAALGEEKISFYGYSYGTFLGQVYATKYPDRVHRLVLDSNVKPDYPGYGDGGGRTQLVGFEKVITEFFDWIADRDAAYGLGTSADEVAKKFYAEREALTERPVGEIGPTEWTDVFLIAGYSEAVWTIIADAFADWLSGDRALVERIYSIVGNTGDDNAYAAFNSTLCTDGPWPRDYPRGRADAFALEDEAPFLVWESFWFSAPCFFWEVPSGKATTVDGSKIDVPVLVINATSDGATPFVGALAVREEFPTSVLLEEVGGTTHGTGLKGNSCIDDIIAAYLATGELPGRTSGRGSDAQCERSPLPEPSLTNRGAPLGTELAQLGIPITFQSLPTGVAMGGAAQ